MTARLCPHCEKSVEKITALDERAHKDPRPGDFVLCYSCCEWAVVEPDLQYRKATDADMIDWETSYPREYELSMSVRRHLILAKMAAKAEERIEEVGKRAAL